MDFRKAYEKLCASSVFTTWQKENSNYYLVHFLTQVDQNFKHEDWQVGFYSKEEDKIVTFIVKETIEEQPAAEVFKKDGIVHKLDLDKINISFDQAIEKSRAVQKEKYPSHLPLKGIIILQHLEKPVWNTTFITQSFTALNIKLDCESGKILSDNVTTFFDLKKDVQ